MTFLGRAKQSTAHGATGRGSVGAQPVWHVVRVCVSSTGGGCVCLGTSRDSLAGQLSTRPCATVCRILEESPKSKPRNTIEESRRVAGEGGSSTCAQDGRGSSGGP